MPDYTEITAWSTEELREQIRKALPSGWRIQQGDDDGHLWFRFLQPKGDDWAVIWDNYHFDEKTLLLDAYCWLWLRDQPKLTPEESVWAPRRGELTQKGVTRRATAVPDPEDLDPVEVWAVYEDAARNKRR